MHSNRNRKYSTEHLEDKVNCMYEPLGKIMGKIQKTQLSLLPLSLFP